MTVFRNDDTVVHRVVLNDGSVDTGDIAVDQMMGSWAGAMGQSQFMPSSYLAYAVDYDGDGRRDIWHSLHDRQDNAGQADARDGRHRH